MKGDVGMSVHEKKGKKKMPRPRQEIIDNPIPTSLFFNGVATYLQVLLKLHPQYPQTTEQLQAHKQRCRDRVINEFLSQSRHPLVPLVIHELTSLHSPSFLRNDLSIWQPMLIIELLVIFLVCLLPQCVKSVGKCVRPL